MSPEHLKLLSKTMLCYNLPKPIFVEGSIAFGVSFGFLTYQAMRKKEYVVVVNCGDVFLTVSVIEFKKNEMKMMYTKSAQFGGRILTKRLRDFAISKSNRKDVSSLTEYQLLQEMVKWKNQINTHQINTTMMSIIGAFGNENDDDLELLINHSEFEDYCKESLKPFEEVLQVTLKYLESKKISMYSVVPMGGAMRSVLLQEVTTTILKKPLSLTARMDEENAMGACRISHLLREKRITFNEKLKNCGVCDPEETNSSMFVKSAGKMYYFVNCSDEYLNGLKESMWQSLSECSPEELAQCSEGEDWLGGMSE